MIGDSVLKSFGNVHTAVIYGYEMYLTLSNAKTSIRKINLINFSGVTTLSTSNTTIFKTLTADINLITISSNNILSVLPDKFEIYKLSDATLKSTHTITLTPHTKQILLTDEFGRVYTNTQTSVIYDMNLGKEILHTSLSFISQNDLLNIKYLNVFNGGVGVVLQSDTQIKILTNLTPSTTELTIPKYNVTVSNSTNVTRIELGRMLSYKLGIGTHNIELKNTDSLNWQSGFDLAFNLSSGFGEEFTELDNTIEILCTLKLVVNGTKTTKSVILTNIVKNLDIMSNRYSILGYRLSDDNTQTFEQWIKGKTISFDTTQNNISFDIKVPNTIRTKRNSVVYFNTLKTIQYYTAGKLIIL
ncbi:hypothetical protein HYO65_gp015 [Tenacibaculum phage PTm1]|uniref:Uncharacterized protein n=2 Tax=Shirahamavirus PTm1 TaxID=2846435 RepID=A0A5S9BYY1_9CAUD|nr:hypothetical protein HYO65_gp015 [Tenacibaculum phage PTm1]BBI90407.1 hypothetical protein [Tenacibaculum phage PTm1]BBI90716.1 hypothetical protein [Tenacibaculum phage PTm5]